MKVSIECLENYSYLVIDLFTKESLEVHDYKPLCLRSACNLFLDPKKTKILNVISILILGYMH